MATAKKKGLGSLIIGLLVAVALWFLNERDLLDELGLSDIPELWENGSLTEAEVSPEVFSPVKWEGEGWTHLSDCSLITGRNGDGDSFHVSHGQGETEFRLYFVDAPESEFREYPGGEDNGERIAEQGRAMGGLDQQATTRVGRAAKQFVKERLREGDFEILTKWENVFGPERRYCFVIVRWEGREVYLHELLVTQGLVRIHSRGTGLPQGRGRRAQESYLRTLEQLARLQKAGVWGL
jgi:endonuclease YncB( thermonuclease family)